MTVVDPSGAVIVGARVEVSPAGQATVALDTSARGDALFDRLVPGRHAIHVESAGFEPHDARDVRVRSGENRRVVTLAIAKLAETVRVATDPRSDAFATVLRPEAIAALPDDPDEMERVLTDMAGPGAVIRINGFRGGRLPPKDQILQIRFRRNVFAADTHDAGSVFVDIVTKPGLDGWRGATTAGFRTSALNARHAFAPVKTVEQHERYGVSASGPLWKQHTSLSLSADTTEAFDSKTIVAALPAGPFADSVRRPIDVLNLTARLEHALSRTQMLRAELQRNRHTSGNLGVGDFDLPERGYGQSGGERVTRLSTAGSIGRRSFNEFRVQVRSDAAAFSPQSAAPAVTVLNAFTTGGAQIDGARSSRMIEVSDDLDVAVGNHALRTGFLFESTRFETTLRRNGSGTFTFASLDAFASGSPTTFSRNIGDPRAGGSLQQTGVYVQDDYRARKHLTISGGLRLEHQSIVGGVQPGPRAAFVWSPFASGTTTVRGGAGVFFDWLDTRSYEQVVQLDGSHQRIETTINPGYPEIASGGHALVLPSGRLRLARDRSQPRIIETLLAVERTLPHDIRASAAFTRRQGTQRFRGLNVNAPAADGRRPDPASGPVTEIASIARSDYDGLTVTLNYNPSRRPMFAAAAYTLSRSLDDADGVFTLPADSRNLLAERGPAAGDARHRFTSLFSAPLAFHVRVGTSIRLQSALPYTVITGRDDNGDTISNDRPPGVTRNSRRGRAQADIGARVSWWIAFGVRPTAGGAPGPQVRSRGDEGNPLANFGAGDPGKRFNLEVYAQAFNLLNHTNALNFSGVMTSPFFGHATSAAPPRRIELGTRLRF